MTTIKSSVDILIKVQEIDRELYQETMAIQQQIPEERDVIKRGLETEKSRLKELEELLKTCQLKQKQKEALLADKEANIKKLLGQLAQVKTNKEYSAIQQEVASLKADNSLLEEDIIKVFDEVEVAEQEVKKEKERLKGCEKEAGIKESELAQREKKFTENLNELKKSRDELIKQVPDDIREKYNLIISKKQGLALVKIKGENCGACQMQLRPQVLNEVRLGEAVVLCESCSRILYYAAE